MKHLILSLALTALASPLASGQGTLTYSDMTAWAQTGYTVPGSSTYFSNDGTTQDYSGADFYGIEDRYYSSSDFFGHGYAELGATFSPSNPYIGGSFSSVVLDACTSAEVYVSSIGTHDFENAYGLASGLIEFTISAPMIWSWSGGWQGGSLNTGAYNEVDGKLKLTDLGTLAPIVNDVEDSVNGVGDWAKTFAYGGLISPGLYRLEWEHQSIVAGGSTFWGFYGTGQGGAPLISCINSTFTLTPVPAPGVIALIGLGGLVAARRRRA